MPKKEIVQVNLAAANPNLSPAARFGNLGFVAGQTGRHPITGACAEKKRLPTASTAIGSINRRAFK
jgi:enamine deaminase RidA (YjgF/YER057c/UK114 family)